MALPITLTSAEILRQVNRDLAYYQQPMVAAMVRQREAAEQAAAQKVALVDQPCPADEISVVQYHLPAVKAPAFRELVRQRFYDPIVMIAASCVVEAIYVAHRGEVDTDRLERIRYWLHDLRQIGAESVEGYALQANLDTAHDVFILKAPRTGKGSLLHEYVVGLTGTNLLRQRIPNYAYILGSFRCSPPFIDQKSVIGWCNTERPSVDYVVYENVTPAVSLSSILAQAPFERFLNAYVQILLALQVGFEMVDFTHYDLHSENVLLREVPGLTGVTDAAVHGTGRPFALAYPTRAGTYYVTSTFVGTLIDYGFAHVHTNKGNFGVYGLSAYGVHGDSSYPLFDAYKLLGMSMRDMYTGKNTKAFQEAAKILTYFNPKEPAVRVILDQSNNYYSLPWIPQLTTLDLIGLINHIRAVFNPSFLTTVDPNLPRLHCRGPKEAPDGSPCLQREAVLTQMGLTGAVHVNKLLKLAQAIQSQSPDITIDFNLRATYTEAVRLMRGAVAQDRHEINVLNTHFPRGNMLTPAYYEAFKSYVYGLMRLIARMQQASALQEALTLVAEKYHLPTKDLISNGQDITSAYEELRRPVQSVQAVLKQIQGQAVPATFKWYRETLPVLATIMIQATQAS